MEKSEKTKGLSIVKYSYNQFENNDYKYIN